jgi:hypothetical protein
MLSVMGAFAEFERALLRERQRENIHTLHTHRTQPSPMLSFSSSWTAALITTPAPSVRQMRPPTGFHPQAPLGGKTAAGPSRSRAPAARSRPAPA